MRKIFPALAAVVLTGTPARAGDSKYQTPPDVITRMVEAPPPPSPLLAPDRRSVLLLTARTLPPISEVSAPEVRLAGLRINPRNDAQSRQPYLRNVDVLDLGATGAKPRPITGLPPQPRIADVRWSPDSKRFTLTVTDQDSVTLWLVDPATAQARRVTETRLSSVLGSPCRWLGDNQRLLCRTVPIGRSAAPSAPSAPSGPVIQENLGAKRPARTNPDLLTGPHDEALFEHHVTTQLALIGIDGKVTPIGKPALYGEVSSSPDDQHLMVQVLHRPYSYRVAIQRFAHRIEVWTMAGKVERVIVDNPLAEDVPVDFDAVRTGPRSAHWRSDADATLCWVEARDGGDPKNVAAVRDELICLAAPGGSPQVVARLEMRFRSVQWGNGALALVSEARWKDRKIRTHRIAPDDAKVPARVLWDRSYEDRYSDPGNPVMRVTARGTQVLHITPAGQLLLIGKGASDQGDRPFLDRLDLATGKTERVWRSEAPTYGWITEIVDDTGDEVILSQESVSDVPQLFLCSFTTGKRRQLTRTPHPAPALVGVDKRLIKYKRKDGLELSAMLYLPPGYQPSKAKPLPVLVWAYPQEFKTAAAASQVNDSPYRFTYPWWGGPLFALTQGYAVVDNPIFAIVGEGTTEPNDTYVPQLVGSAQALVDELVRLRVGDRDRMAIGGHSYGAFTAANLLAHSDLFRTGIARSGAYNRTLTPFGFQAEERTFWAAAATYIDMSPFAHADQIDEPLLLIHGAVDENDGTYPIQTERLFQAIQGLGGTARYVSLPAETHGYRARESVLHVLWEQVHWLDEHVKKAGPRRPQTGRVDTLGR